MDEIEFDNFRLGWGLPKRLEKEIETKREYGTIPELDEIIDTGIWKDRLNIAVYGYGLDKLMHDRDGRVRAEVVAHGYELDEMITDKDPEVKLSIARNSDKYLYILMYDKDSHVRLIVARKGYGLQVLYYDDESRVQIASEHWLEENDLDIGMYKNMLVLNLDPRKKEDRKQFYNVA